MLFCICSDSGMTGADVRVGSCRYLLNQQTLVILFSLYGTGILRDIKQIRQYDIKSIASGYIKSFAVIVLFTILGGIMQFILSSGNNEQSINEITLRMTMKEHYWAIMILSAFIGPILEELIFRWFIFSSINKRLIIKVIVSSVLFGLMHFIPSIGAISLNELCLQAIQYVLAGIAFCLVYIKRGNVVFGIAAHMSINLMHNLMSAQQIFKSLWDFLCIYFCSAMHWFVP